MYFQVIYVDMFNMRMLQADTLLAPIFLSILIERLSKLYACAVVGSPLIGYTCLITVVGSYFLTSLTLLSRITTLFNEQF